LKIKSLVENAIQGAHGIIPNPNLIVWTGDTVPHINDDYNQQCLFEIAGYKNN
jgi:hypothetical protein